MCLFLVLEALAPPQIYWTQPRPTQSVFGFEALLHPPTPAPCVTTGDFEGCWILTRRCLLLPGLFKALVWSLSVPCFQLFSTRNPSSQTTPGDISPLLASSGCILLCLSLTLGPLYASLFPPEGREEPLTFFFLFLKLSVSCTSMAFCHLFCS